MGALTRAAVCVVLAGCLSKPGLSQRDGAIDEGGGGDGGSGDASTCTQPSGGLTRTQDAFDQEVIGISTGASVTFADPGAKYPMPIAMHIGGEQLIANAGGCTREDQVGVAAFPVYTIAGNQTPTAPNIHPLDVVVDGPAYKELVSNWTYQHATECQTGDGLVQGDGRTTWAFYPDGRIVRHDDLQPVSAGTHRPTAMCACVPNSFTWIITSYFAFDETMVSALTGFGDSEGSTPIPGRPPATMPPAVNPDLQDRVGACFATPANARAAIRWDTSSAGRRDTRIRYFNELAFVTDLVPGSGAGADDMLSSADTFTVRTHLFLDASGAAGSCTLLNNKLLRHASSPPARVDGQMITVGRMGYYDDTILQRTHDAAVSFVADFGPIEDGWALKIKFPGFRSITTSVPSHWQHEADDTFYIFFPGELENDQIVTITPECPT